MSIKNNAIIIRDENSTGKNTAARVGGNLVEIADDLIVKQSLIDSNTAKVGITPVQVSDITSNNTKTSFDSTSSSKLDGIEVGAQVNTINSSAIGEPTGSDLVYNIVKLTQAEYDAGTPVSTTAYFIPL